MPCPRKLSRPSDAFDQPKHLPIVSKKFAFVQKVSQGTPPTKELTESSTGLIADLLVDDKSPRKTWKSYPISIISCVKLRGDGTRDS